MMFFIPPAILAIEDEDDRSFMENLYRSYYRLMYHETQENGYYCGPATACMVAKTLGLGTYTQKEMASLLGTTTSGTSGAQICNTLNSLLSKTSDTRRFQRVTISTAALETSVRSSLRNDFPLTLNVKEMPNYTSGSGHFIAVKGYYFNTSTDFKTITICDPHPTYSGTYTYTLEEMETAVESSNGYYNRLDASTV